MQPVRLEPALLVMLRDKSLAKITYLVDGPEPFELLGNTVAQTGRPLEPMLWQADGHYGDERGTHALDIVGIEMVGEGTADGRARFAPFTGLRATKKKKGGQS
jgi:hypothetical protein